MLDQTEHKYNLNRLSGETFSQLDVYYRLYALLNLLESFDSYHTYANINQWYRRYVNDKGAIKNQDAYTLAIAENYGYNVVPYFEAWGVDISDQTKSTLDVGNYQYVSILSDLVSEAMATEIKIKENLHGEFALVSNELLSKYGLKGSLDLTIQIQNLDDVIGKYIYLMDGETSVAKVKITSETVVFDDLPVGTYTLQMPIPNGDYVYDPQYVIIKEGQNEATFDYRSTDTSQQETCMWLGIKGIYNTYGFKMELNSTNEATITLGGADLGNRNASWANRPDEVYTSIKILDPQGQTVYSKEAKGNNYLSLTTVTEKLTVDSNYVVEIYHDNPQNYVKVFSQVTGNEIENYRTTEKTTRYVIKNCGFVKENMTDEEFDQINYEVLASQLKEMMMTINVTSLKRNYKIKKSIALKKVKFLPRLIS